jgi:hypothetical protein
MLQTVPTKERYPTNMKYRFFLSEMDANIIRDRHFFAILLDLVKKGERVFAVAGSSHAVKLEPALKVALTTPTSPDQARE